MLDKEKCRYLLKTAQFDELLDVLEKEYVEIMDKFLTEYVAKENLDKLIFSEKVKLVVKYKPESKMVMYTLASTYLNDEDDVAFKIEDLMDLYFPVCEMLKK